MTGLFLVYPLIVTLVRHMFRHSGYKPHQCRFCDMAFPVEGDLVRLLTIHKEEKAYPCSDYGKTFSVKDILMQIPY